MIGENGFVLENDVELPFLGFDAAGMQDANVLRAALNAGYRHFYVVETSCAALEECRKAAGLTRRELFLTASVSPADADAMQHEINRLLDAPGVLYLDLLLLSAPAGDTRDTAADWRVLEEFYNLGLVRAIGLRGFLPQHILPLLRTAKVKPMANLLPYAPGRIPAVTAAFCLSHGVQLLGGEPFVRGEALSEPIVLSLAERYGKTAAQVCLRFALQNNVLPLLRATDAADLRKCFGIFDFELSLEELYELMTIGE